MESINSDYANLLNIVNLLDYMCPAKVSFKSKNKKQENSSQKADASVINPLAIRYHYLFANGKFSIEYEGKCYKIVGIKHRTSFLVNIPGDTGLTVTAVDILECNLLARPISDMSNQEQDHALKLKRIKTEGAKEEEYAETMEYLFYLLSIGVYPFDQSHFKDKG